MDEAAPYLLYVCPYTELNLKPNPTPTVETPQLWNWDVAEAFIGSDFEHIGRYKEFQVSPQGEWVDLAIDRDDPKGQEGMKWNSGYTVRARIDARAKIWYGLMRIPFQSVRDFPSLETKDWLTRLSQVPWQPSPGVGARPGKHRATF